MEAITHLISQLTITNGEIVRIYTFLLAILLSLSTPSYSAVGVISEQDNAPATIMRSSSSITGAKGAGIEMADAIETLNGKVGITFVDNTRVEVNDHSKLEIDEFVYDPSKPTAGKLAFNFAQGTVQYTSGAIAKNNPANVGINTPSATIAVRGTDFTATVDEAGASTIILLPSCPKNWKNIETDCKTGRIEVINDAGSVSLYRPFEGTKVNSRSEAPTKPVVLKLTTTMINNLLIVSPPGEINKIAMNSKKVGGGLDTNFLDDNLLDNLFLLVNPYTTEPAEDQTQVKTSNVDPYADIHKKLPDWKIEMKVTPYIKTDTVGVCRSDSTSNVQCITMPANQNSTIIQMQGSSNIVNRVNSGGNTIITLRQN